MAHNRMNGLLPRLADMWLIGVGASQNQPPVPVRTSHQNSDGAAVVL
jgi:hypothetical protein